MRYQRQRRMLSEMNVIPYIDVMLVLLVIFMITTPLLTQGVKVNMPNADAKALEPSKAMPIIVTVDKQGHYYLNIAKKPDVPKTAEQIITRVTAELILAKEKGQTCSVLVKGDENVNYGKVITAMVLLQKAGATDVGLMTKPPKRMVITT